MIDPLTPDSEKHKLIDKLNLNIENAYKFMVVNKYTNAITPEIIQLQCKIQLQVLQSFNKQKAIKTVVIVNNNVIHIAAVNP